MSIQSLLNEIKAIYCNLLSYIDDEVNDVEKYDTLKSIFDDQKIREDPFRLKTLLHLITNISNHHHRNSTFFTKIDQIILSFKEEIKVYYSNDEIFSIFNSNKRLLLLLFNEKIMIMNEKIALKMISHKFLSKFYLHYFQPELKPFITDEFLQKNSTDDNYMYIGYIKDYLKKEIPDDFEENRQKGENEKQICELIRNDMIEDFIIYMAEQCYSINSYIDESIFETNCFLVSDSNLYYNKLDGKKYSLIEYAAFFGSIQIFNYLQNYGADMRPSLWNYIIHSNNAELINIIDENVANESNPQLWTSLLNEAISCHHNEIANYILSNHLDDSNFDVLNNIFIQCLKYFDFELIKENFIDQSELVYLSKYDHIMFVDILLNDDKIDLNITKIIKAILFFKCSFF